MDLSQRVNLATLCGTGKAVFTAANGDTLMSDAEGKGIGDLSKIEIVWHYHGPRWRGRPEVAQIREPAPTGAGG